MILSMMVGLAAAAPAHNPAEPVSWEVPELGRVVLVEDHRVPLVEVRVSFPVGEWSPWFRESGGAEAFQEQLYDPDGALRARADALAARISLDTDAYSSTLSLGCLKDDLPDALELVQDVLFNRDYDPAEIGRAKKARKIGWKAQLKDPDFVLEQASRRALFAEGDPRRYAAEEPPPVVTDGAKLSQVRDAIVRLEGRVVGFAGDVTRAEIDAMVLGLLPPVEPAPGPLAPSFSPETSERPAHTRATLPSLTQVYFELGRAGLTWDDPDYPTWLVADHVLGGHFYSRLYVALRHESGETYGAMTRRQGGPAPDLYTLYTFTRTENAAPTEEKLRETLATFQAGGITEDERAGAVGNLLGGQAFEVQAPAQVLDSWLWEEVRGLPPGWRAELAARAASVDLASVNAFIHDFYAPASFSLSTVEPD